MDANGRPVDPKLGPFDRSHNRQRCLPRLLIEITSVCHSIDGRTARSDLIGATAELSIHRLSEAGDHPAHTRVRAAGPSVERPRGLLNLLHDTKQVPSEHLFDIALRVAPV